jgi:Lsr2
MAKITVVSLIDDLDGRTGDESLQFALDGSDYEIDLSTKNATKLRKALAPFVASARRGDGRGGRKGTRAGSTAVRARNDDTTAIRDWARSHGYTVSDRGRVASKVIKAYQEAH